MPLAFLAPWFLAGLALLAVPIAVHLSNRERKQPVAFPSLMFLRQVPHRSVRRRRLRHLALFALRCLAVVLLVAAFARPFVAAARVAARRDARSSSCSTARTAWGPATGGRGRRRPLGAPWTRSRRRTGR